MPLGSPFDATAVRVLRLRRRHRISTGGESTWSTTQRTDQQRSADRRRRELLEAADRVVLRDGPRRLDERHRRGGRHHQAHPLPPLRRQGRTVRARSPSGTPTPCSNSLRAALDAPAERRERVEATLDTYLAAIEARPQVYRFLMHPAEGSHDRRAGLRRRQALRCRCCAAWARSWPRSSRSGSISGPEGQQLARVWGHGIVGMMHAAGDWWLGERPCSRARVGAAVWPICCGGGWPPRATRSAARGSDGRGRGSRP